MGKTNDDVILLSMLKHNQILVEQYINKKKMTDIDYDENFGTISKKNISDRDDSYTNLLKHFVSITRIRNVVKEIHKWLYFWIIIALLFAFIFFIYNILRQIDLTNDNSINNLIMVITSIVSFSSVIISIPLIITKYLFSSEEDKSISNIILHTQQHDIDGKKLLEGINSLDKKLRKLENSTDSYKNSNQEQLVNLVTKTVQMADMELFQNEEDKSEEEIAE